jgi:hypothetical protein
MFWPVWPGSRGDTQTDDDDDDDNNNNNRTLRFHLR